MARVVLTLETIAKESSDLWSVVQHAVWRARQARPGQLPLHSVYVDAVMTTHGAMCNGGWCLAIEDYTGDAVRAVPGFRYFGLEAHAALIERGLKLFREYEFAEASDDEAEAERISEELSAIDSAYYELVEPQSAIDAVIRAQTDRFVFDIEVPDDPTDGGV